MPASDSGGHVRRRQARSAITSVLLVLALAGCSGGGGAGVQSRASPGAATPGIPVTSPRSLLYLLPASGGPPRPLLPAAAAARLQSESDPAWSPDGRLIAFTAGCASCRSQLYVVSRTGLGLRRIRTGPGSVSSPSWAPDGRTIVFARQRGEDQVLYSVDTRTGRLRLVHGEPAGQDNTDTTPAVSPDGRWIAFTREVHHERVSVYLMPAGGGRLRPLTSRTQAGQSRPRWSPDGRQVVFMQAGPPHFTWNLLVWGAGNGRLREVTRDPHNEFDPAWSPDGKRIVFAGDAASRFGFRSLYIINADGSGLRRVTATGADDSGPAWSPDGSTIVFVRHPTLRD